MPKMIRGSEMSSHAQRHALAKFVHRSTKDHRPAWSHNSPVQFASDADWLANTFFYVNKDGSLSKGHRYCQSNPTWPDNPELRKEIK